MSKSKFVIDKLAKLFEQGLISYRDLSSEIISILKSKLLMIDTPTSLAYMSPVVDEADAQMDGGLCNDEDSSQDVN